MYFNWVFVRWSGIGVWDDGQAGPCMGGGGVVDVGVRVLLPGFGWIGELGPGHWGSPG